MPELIDLIRLSEKHIKPASSVLSKAFQNDPIIRWQIPEAHKRLEKAHYIFEIKLRIGISFGEVYGTSENLEGIAIWYSPMNVNISYWKYLIKGGFKLPFKFGRKITKKMTITKAVDDSMRNIYMKVPYWYFGLIGVDPKFQGQGFASKLIKPMLERIDKEKFPIYLETTLERNLPFFRYFNFDKLEEIIIPNTSIVHWSMLRISNI
ncbi:MAG: GNAT family N-acetyltransferase [Candidatus Hodarchaeota archaeon]